MAVPFYSILRSTHQVLCRHPHVIGELEKRLSLSYQEVKDSEGNVCFMTSEEVRIEYRVAFNSTDVAYYLFAIFQEAASAELANEGFHLKFPFPDSAIAFWKIVERGHELIA